MNTNQANQDDANDIAELCKAHSFQLEYTETLSLPENNSVSAKNSIQSSPWAMGLCHRSGVRLYFVSCNSQESAFSYCFATPPENDKGLAHIVEHAVFCGSQNYQLKEPFANLQKTSLYSFLNAMTYPDQTLYPAASAFAADFIQLLKVYGDAVFFPLLEDQAIAQEGVRQTDEGLDGIVFNEMQGYYGDFEAYVADYSLRSLFPKAILRIGENPGLPAHPNSFDAGGDPRAIANIDCRDYSEVREFHRRHYRPQNCRITMYGSILQQHLGEILDYLDSLFRRCQNLDSKHSGNKSSGGSNSGGSNSGGSNSMDSLTTASPNPSSGPSSSQPAVSFNEPGGLNSRVIPLSLVPLVPFDSPVSLPFSSFSPWTSWPPLPERQNLYQPVPVLQASDKQRSIMFSWVLPAQQDVLDSLEYRLMAELLLGHSGAVLEQPVMQSGWGADLSLGSGLELELANPVLRIGLSAYTPADGDCFRKLIFSALHQFCNQAEQGGKAAAELDLLWQAALNSLEYEEYSLGEHGGDDGIYALERCLQMAKASHFYHSETQSSYAVTLGILQPFAGIAALRASGLAAFTAKIRSYTLENPHWSLQLFEEISAKPEQLAITVKPELQLDPLTLYQRQKAFSLYQERRDDPQQVAKITVMDRSEFGDLPPQPESLYTREASVEFFCCGKDNDLSLAQVELYWEISTWSPEQSVLLPLFLDLVEDMGLPGLSYIEVAKQKSLHIGHWEAGFSFKPVFQMPDSDRESGSNHSPAASLRSFVHIQLSFLPAEWSNGLALFWQLLADGDWQDKERLLELLQSNYYEKSQELCSSPLNYATRRSRYRLSCELVCDLDNPNAGILSNSSREQAQQNEWFYGLGQVELLAQICQQQDFDCLAASFGQLRKDLLQMPLSCAITASQQQLGQLRQEITAQLADLRSKVSRTVTKKATDPMIGTAVNGNQPQMAAWASKIVGNASQASGDRSAIELWRGSIALENLSIAIPAPPWHYLGSHSPHTAKGKPTLDSVYPAAHPAMELFLRLLQNGPAWEKIRLQQGAYGVRVQQQGGFLLFCSSQDPDSLNSMSLFRKAVEEVRDKILAADSEFCSEFESALVQILSEKLKDLPRSDHARIALHFAKTGLHYQDQAEWLQQLRQLQLADLQQMAEYILRVWSFQASCIFAATDRIETGNNRNIQLESRSLPRYA